tara:strand:- start:11 stop:187 length:177 start_codon:yes stop_codon:yes gene_type:complete
MRENGYYWVETDEGKPKEVAYSYNYLWYFVGEVTPCTDVWDFNPTRIITPDESESCND